MIPKLMASEMIAALQKLIAEHGDRPLLVTYELGRNNCIVPQYDPTEQAFVIE